MTVKNNYQDILWLIKNLLGEGRKTKRGLFSYLIIFSIANIYLIDSFNWYSEAFHTQPIYFILCQLALVASLFIFWLIDSGRYILPSAAHPIIFAIDTTNAQGRQSYKMMISNLRYLLNQPPFVGRFRIIELPVNLIKNRIESEGYAKRYPKALIFFGRISSGKVNGEIIDEFKIQVTWSYSSYGPPIAQYALDGKFFIEGRDWNFRDFNSKLDGERIAHSFSEIVLFLTTLGQIKRTDELEWNVQHLESLLKTLRERTRKDINELVESGGSKLTPDLLRQGRVTHLLQELFFELGKQAFEVGDFKRAEYYVQRGLNFPGSTLIGPVLMALIKFKLGQLGEAKRFTQKIRIAPNGGPAYYVNQAFFSILDKKYSKTLDNYLLLLENKDLGSQFITGVLEFLDERRKETPGEPAYHFALGVLNLAYLDKTVGRSDIKTFLKKCPDDAVYKPLKLAAECIQQNGLKKACSILNEQKARKIRKRPRPKRRSRRKKSRS